MKSTYMLSTATALAVILCQAPSAMRAHAQNQEAIAGQVSSAAEGAMEGVVVTARKDGSIVSVSVATDAKGHYAFPESRLEPGHYTLAIRAVGYDLAAPAAANVASEQTAIVHQINAGPGLPTFSPRRTHERGVANRPTAVNNVETLAHLALIARYGDAWFREAGVPASPWAPGPSSLR